MSLALFLLIVVLIVISAVVYTAAMLVFTKIALRWSKQLQLDFINSLEDDDEDLDEHAAEAPNMQFFNN